MEFLLNPLNQICYVPLVGALIIIFALKREQTRAIQAVATVTAGLDFVISVPLWWRYLPEGEPFQFVFKASWIPSIGSSYHFGVDGISVLLILLTTLLGFIAVYSSFTAITHRNKEYYAFLLLLQTGMLGVFMSLDFVLFYVFWEVMLVPMYFLIGIWGGPRKLYAAIKFFMYTLVGSVLMLVASWPCTSTTPRASRRSAWRASATPPPSTSRSSSRSHHRSPAACRCGSSWRSSWASPSRCRCSRSTPGCRTPTSRRPPPARSSWQASC